MLRVTELTVEMVQYFKFYIEKKKNGGQRDH